MYNQIITGELPFLDDESKNEDEDQRCILQELEGGQDNITDPCNVSGDYQQNLLVSDAIGSHSATEHQSEPMLLEAKLNEATSTLAQQPSTLQGTYHKIYLIKL